MRLTFGVLSLQVGFQHRHGHFQTASGLLGQRGLALVGGHGQAMHQHRERIFLQLGNGPKAPTQGLGFFTGRGGCERLAIGTAVHAGDVQSASHALPHSHGAIGTLVHHHRDVAIGVDRQKLGGAGCTAGIGRGDELEWHTQLQGGPQRSCSARSADAVNFQSHLCLLIPQ
jgi:hypothetical protein